MNKATRTLLFWTPRVLCLAVALFLALFAFDVFGEPGTVWMKVVGFAIHLAPTWALLVVLALAWRWEWIGAAACFAMAGFYAATFGRHHLDWDLIIAGPVVLVGVLFLVGWVYRKQIRATAPAP
jgi:hypothetical protein